MFHCWTAISDAAAMCRFMLPSLCAMTGHDTAMVSIVTGIFMVNDHHMPLVPMKGAKIVVKRDMNATVPVKMTIGWTYIIGIGCPIYRWVVIPGPMTIDDSWIVIGHVDYLFLDWLYDDLIIDAAHRHVLHLG